VRIAGPKRRPAGPHRGEKLGLRGESEEALELAGKVGVGAVLDQRRGTHHAGLAAGALATPSRQQRLRYLGRDRPLVEREPDLDRELARLRGRCGREARQQIVEPERLDLRPIGRGRETEPARRRQARLRQRRQVGGLRPHPLRVGGGSIGEGENESGHRAFVATLSSL